MYFPTDFSGLELIVRNNFAAATSLLPAAKDKGLDGYGRKAKQTGLLFYASSADANEAIKGTSQTVFKPAKMHFSPAEDGYARGEREET